MCVLIHQYVQRHYAHPTEKKKKKKKQQWLVSNPTNRYSNQIEGFWASRDSHDFGLRMESITTVPWREKKNAWLVHYGVNYAWSLALSLTRDGMWWHFKFSMKRNPKPGEAPTHPRAKPPPDISCWREKSKTASSHHHQFIQHSEHTHTHHHDEYDQPGTERHPSIWIGWVFLHQHHLQIQQCTQLLEFPKRIEWGRSPACFLRTSWFFLSVSLILLDGITLYLRCADQHARLCTAWIRLAPLPSSCVDISNISCFRKSPLVARI
jgi:hypothetical protein